MLGFGTRGSLGIAVLRGKDDRGQQLVAECSTLKVGEWLRDSPSDDTKPRRRELYFAIEATLRTVDLAVASAKRLSRE